MSDSDDEAIASNENNSHLANDTSNNQELASNNVSSNEDHALPLSIQDGDNLNAMNQREEANEPNSLENVNMGERVLQDEQIGDEDDHDDGDEEDDEDDDEYEDEGEDYFYTEDEEENHDEEDEPFLNEDTEDYESVQKPEATNYNRDLPTSHPYLGQNFQEVTTPKDIHKMNDEFLVPLLYLPGNSYDDEQNNVQLIPGQIMPIYFYSPLQIQVINKRMNDPNPTIGFALNTKFIRSLLLQQQQQQGHNSSITDQRIKIEHEDNRLGILAEIMSVSNNEANGETQSNSLLDSGIGIVIKVKGRERFEILDLRKDITGCLIANVKILPDYVLSVNPLSSSCYKNNTQYFYDTYLCKSKPSNNSFLMNMTAASMHSKAELLNISQPHFAWMYRKYDCNYLMYLIKKELSEAFGNEFNMASSSSGETISSTSNPLVFSLWLLNNLPFDNQTRIACLKMNCINQRLIYIQNLLKNFTNIICKNCKSVLCSKSDAFSLSKQGYMSAFLNPGGVIHETLTVYKLKNFIVMKDPPSLEHTWFPEYGWQICVCRSCQHHIGWKFTTKNKTLRPEKFFGLTRKSINYAYVEDATNKAIKKLKLQHGKECCSCC